MHLQTQSKKPRSRSAQLGQYMTPAWAARELWGIYFPHIGPGKTVIEPTCGDGRMLQAIPPDVDAYGIEIDPVFADAARHRVPERDVFTADVLAGEFPRRFDVVFGNPPFETRFMDKLLALIAAYGDDGCQCGLALPAYFLQTPSRVIRWNKKWTICAEILPRTLFPRLRLPIVFGLFTKDPVPQLKGIRLVNEADAIDNLRPEYKEMMVHGKGLWDQVVEHALRELDGEAHLTFIYEKVGRRRPTDNPHWREKVRQTLQRCDQKYQPRGNGVWKLLKEAA